MTVAAFGEIMLRLTVPDYLLLEQSERLDMSFTGTGVNILSSLSHLGHQTEMISTLPANRLGATARLAVRQLGIGDDLLLFQGDHMGSFFVELGYGNRPETVTYQNRLASAFCTQSPAAYDFKNSLSNLELMHICGISLSLTDATRTAALQLAELARTAEVPVCFDFNYRVALNQHNETEQMRAYYQQILKSSKIVFGSRRDLTDLMGYSAELDDETLFKQFVGDYNLDLFAGTQRSEQNGRDSIRGFACQGNQLYWSEEQTVTILDRIGGGDAYAAGVLHGMLSGQPIDDAVNFGVANAALAHAQIGDSPRATESQVNQFIANRGRGGQLIR